MPIKRRIKSKVRKGSSYWQRWIVLIAAIFVFYTAFRPGPQVNTLNSWAHDLSGDGGRDGGDGEGEGSEAGVFVPPGANDTRIRPEGAPLSPVPRYG